MKLSIIIVNYNVRYFLEQCLFSVYKAISQIEAEVIVVDNNSVDGSEVMIRSRFPEIKLIVNQQNLGFAKANNQALTVAKGEYMLLLNPDTVLEETTLGSCLSFMDLHKETGALGPKMIDGKGRFLPESKRGLPTPKVAFYKIFGLALLFPKSKRFGKYYLGHTSNDETQEVEVLTGAFMLIRRSVLDVTGFLDESFFMYGEDIDLSFRISQAGFKLYYYPETSIIHYKGESTKKGSLNYVIIFYKAMKIFANKAFTGNMVNIYSFLISFAIYLRAGLSVLNRSLRWLLPLFLDASITYIGCYQLALLWANIHFHRADYYSSDILSGGILVFSLAMVSANLLFGGYRSPYNLLRVSRAILYGAIIVLVVYALLPLQLRFSRILILFGSAWSLVVSIIVRVLLSLTGFRSYRLDLKKRRRIAIVGFQDESERIKELLKLSGVVMEQIMHVCPKKETPSEYFCGNLGQLREIIDVHRINEVVFCAKDIASEIIIENMKALKDTSVDFKIASPGSNSVIGSNSANTSGDLYTIKVD
ncbi:MAG TPA: glycosyltransferase [Bacteroidales bacterium]